MNFSIRLAKRNAFGHIIPGQYVTFETNSGAELADFYEKNAVENKPGKRHDKVLANKTDKKHQRRDKSNDAQLSSSGAGK